jgi:type II secretory pathway pseudopilin PulG
VLVIIGLLVGGIILGRELIKNAQWRKLASDLSTYEASARTFQLKYSQLPGDMNYASQFWGTNCQDASYGNTTCNGNNNQIINAYEWPASELEGWPNANDGSQADWELPMFWRHLYLAEMLDQKVVGFLGGGGTRGCGWTGITLPETQFKLGIAAAGRGFFVGNYDATLYPARSGWGVKSETLQPWSTAEVKAFEQKMDDGTSTAGKIKWIRNYSGVGQCVSGTGFSNGQMCAMVWEFL